MVGIFMTTYNFLEKTKKAYLSLKEHTCYPYEFFIIDNHSEDGTREWAEENNIKYIADNSGNNLAKALNQAVKHLLENGQIEYVCWIHNDMLFLNNWLKNLVDFSKKHSQCGKIHPANWFYIQSELRSIWKEPSQIDGTEFDYVDLKNFYDSEGEEAEKFMDINHYNYGTGNDCPWIIPRKVFEDGLWFDEEYQGIANYEDWDFNNHLLENNYEVVIYYGSLIWHPLKGTRSTLPSEQQERFNRLNEERYKKKWPQYWGKNLWLVGRGKGNFYLKRIYDPLT
ncbi:MAG: glycosyltransferase [Spirochaetes bacterium]|nr:glycosyltransferase [Spirochaetota bacterium]